MIFYKSKTIFVLYCMISKYETIYYFILYDIKLFIILYCMISKSKTDICFILVLV
jgi:flagellar assembly factor FliW